MSHLIERIENLEDVIEKNKEKFSMEDCHNFIVYFKSITEGIIELDNVIKSTKKDNARLHEIIATGHNALMEKFNEIKNAQDNNTNIVEEIRSSSKLVKSELQTINNNFSESNKNREISGNILTEKQDNVIQKLDLLEQKIYNMQAIKENEN